MPVGICLEDNLYSVRKDSSPRYGYPLPDCFADVLPEDAILLGDARRWTWFQAVGYVKIQIPKHQQYEN
jgi:hypothetical protein